MRQTGMCKMNSIYGPMNGIVDSESVRARARRWGTMMDFRLRQLRTIVAVADAHSFTQAGKQLRLSQQSVSALVRDLELRLGTKLFVRTTRSVEPTSDCDALVADLRPALALLDAALEGRRAGCASGRCSSPSPRRSPMAN